MVTRRREKTTTTTNKHQQQRNKQDASQHNDTAGIVIFRFFEIFLHAPRLKRDSDRIFLCTLRIFNHLCLVFNGIWTRHDLFGSLCRQPYCRVEYTQIFKSDANVFKFLLYGKAAKILLKP